MKILIVASYNKNRFAPFIEEQVDYIRSLGHEVLWFGVQGKGIIGYLRAVQALRSIISEVKPDVIHAHYGLSGLVANLATRRIPVVCTYHGSDINNKKVRPLSQLTMSLSAWNIFVSKRIMDIVHAVDWNHCSLIPCGVSLSDNQLQTKEDARKKLAWSMSERRVLFAGAFDNNVKDPTLAMQAMDELTNKGVKAELIELKGYTREQVNTLMCAADSLLLTSKTEGSPQVIKEAMACGCLIVSVDVGDVAERTNGVEGCYVVPTREPRDIANALEKAIAFKGKTNGRERIIECGLTNEQVAKRIIEIYKRVKE